MSAGEIAAYIFDLINKLFAYIMKIVGVSIKFVSEKMK
jgi:hypothetical protein